MKRSPLKRKTGLSPRTERMERSTPLRRVTRLRPKRATARRSERVIDEAFLDFVRGQPCAARGIPGHRCWGRIDPDHLGPRPYGRKADDDTAAPLCRGAHRDRTDYPGPSSGIFRDWPRERMERWKADLIATTRADYARHRDASSAAIPF